MPKERPYIQGGEGKPFELHGPWPDGIVTVARPDGFAAAKLRFHDGAWEQSYDHTLYFDKEGKPLVDIRAAVKEATGLFPDGPEAKQA